MSTLQAYGLKVFPEPAAFSVLRFTGRERLNGLYHYEIEFTCPMADLPTASVLGRPCEFVIDPIDPDAALLESMFGERAAQFSQKPPARTIHGVVTRFEQFGTSADETHYRVVLEPRAADLDRGATSRLFQRQTTPEIIQAALEHYGLREGEDFVLNGNLRGTYPRHEYITQYAESTFAFIQRLAAQAGLYFYFEQTRDWDRLVFGDSLDTYQRNGRTVPFRQNAGLESAGAEAIRTLDRETKRIVQSVQLNDYNHRQADVSLLVEHNAAPSDTTTNGVDTLWGEHYRTPEEGNRIAQLRHEAKLARQLTSENSQFILRGFI
jgi:type VI secretion system secreted protein VgrG